MVLNKAKNFLEKWAFHALLLPVFFVLHSYQQYFGLVSGAVAAKWLFILVAVFALSCLLFWLLTRHLNRSLQLVTLFGFVVLFYGVIKDFLEFTAGLATLSRYSVLLPLTLVVTGLLAWVVLRKKDFRTSNLFQNLLLLIFVVVDTGAMILGDHSLLLKRNMLTNQQVSGANIQKDGTGKPDVYYLIFDCYPSTKFLREQLNFEDTALVSHLNSKGYHIVKSSSSNYNRTAFSLASTLNFQYLQGLAQGRGVSADDYARALLSVKQALVPKMFKSAGYEFYNLSIFDIGAQPAIRKESFLTMPDGTFLLYNTIPGRIRKDLLWNILTGRYTTSFFQKVFLPSKYALINAKRQQNSFNHMIEDSLMNMAHQKQFKPRFVYAHFYLPHPPFFYDENGKGRGEDTIFSPESYRNKDLFLSYLKYTNKVMSRIVDSLGRCSENCPVIIIQGDHGFNDYVGAPTDKKYYFTNFSAFYFPDRDYSQLYDDMTNINTFPILFNKFLGTQIPLQRDSCVLLPD